MSHTYDQLSCVVGGRGRADFGLSCSRSEHLVTGAAVVVPEIGSWCVILLKILLSACSLMCTAMRYMPQQLHTWWRLQRKAIGWNHVTTPCWTVANICLDFALYIIVKKDIYSSTLKSFRITVHNIDRHTAAECRSTRCGVVPAETIV